MTLEPAQIAEQGKKAFANKNFQEAAALFQQAADAFTANRAGIMAAEMLNNKSVALLQAGMPKEAFLAAQDTDKLFAGAKDIKRQAMALGNQAAALEGLKRYDEAITAYEQSADLFALAGEGDLRSMVMKSAAGIKLKTGKIGESAFKMMGSLDVKETPGFFERILKFLLRVIK